MSPTMIFRGLITKGATIPCTSPPCSAMEVDHHKHHGKRRRRKQQSLKSFITPSFLFSSSNPISSHTHRSITTTTTTPSSSSRCLLGEDDGHADYKDSYSSPPPRPLAANVSPEKTIDVGLDDDPVLPEMIRIDTSRFHFSEGDGSLDLNSASLSRKKENDLYVKRERFDQGSGDDLIVEEEKEEDNEELEVKREKEEEEEDEEDPVKKDNYKVVFIRESSEMNEDGLRTSCCSARGDNIEEASVQKSSTFSTRSSDQVVVLRVSLHCRGCERKLKKHLSRMKGVTSFNIDFFAKKVKVVGEVTPLSVLSSVSKVKKAQLWSSPTRSQSTQRAT